METCPSLEDLSAAADGECSPEELAAIEDHFQQCERCRETLGEIRSASASLQTFLRHRAESEQPSTDEDCLSPETLSDYYDRELSPDQVSSVEAHLVRCSRCRHELSLLNTTLRGTELSRLHSPTASAVSRVKSAVASHAGGQAVICAQCQGSIPEGGKYCPHCGTRVGSYITEAEPTSIRRRLKLVALNNLWLLMALGTFCLSFIHSRRYWQWLIATIALVVVWVFGQLEVFTVQQIKRALKSGEEEKAQELFEEFKHTIGKKR